MHTEVVSSLLLLAQMQVQLRARSPGVEALGQKAHAFALLKDCQMALQPPAPAFGPHWGEKELCLGL